MTQTKIDENKKAKPTKEIRFGNIVLSEWTNKYSKTITIHKNYLDKNNNWKKTTNYNENDLIILKHLIKKYFS